jgi:hypothetical protein
MRRMKLKVAVVTFRGSGGDRTLVYWGKTFLLSRSLLFLLKTRFQKICQLYFNASGLLYCRTNFSSGNSCK